jgi:hypothetical protein
MAVGKIVKTVTQDGIKLVVQKWTIRREWKKCGKKSCHCAQNGGQLHGPYLYAYWKRDGKLHKKYLGNVRIEELTNELINELYRDMKMMEDVETVEWEPYMPRQTRKEKIRHTVIQKSFDKLVD